jgi:hypothetical protein
MIDAGVLLLASASADKRVRASSLGTAPASVIVATSKIATTGAALPSGSVALGVGSGAVVVVDGWVVEGIDVTIERETERGTEVVVVVVAGRVVVGAVVESTRAGVASGFVCAAPVIVADPSADDPSTQYPAPASASTTAIATPTAGLRQGFERSSSSPLYE